ncbi:hypothetical protein HN643_04880 [Candidatus Falkowbacteria bacterium]|nr:hypothetical protein [Candidatus Falkowbacteria bacterium]MBT5503018.1 hypothetical protein [Candidatus Falkowbacteria bacterium]MBT7500973.1 hypothetical protein [Candidatus Falkowbacteria bacterium]
MVATTKKDDKKEDLDKVLADLKKKNDDLNTRTSKSLTNFVVCAIFR